MRRILVTAPIPAHAREILEPLGQVEVADRWDPSEMARAIADTEVLISRGHNKIDADVIAAATRLCVIGRTGSGYDNIDVGAATSRGIPVVTVRSEGAVPVAEGTFALILAAAKRLGELDRATRTGNWNARFEIQGLDLDGAVLGIVGFGNIGSRVARLGSAFGMSVLAHDPRFEEGTTSEGGVRFTGLAELVSESDVVSLHCELTDSSRGLFDRALLQQTKPGAILVNAARGALVEGEDVLLEALESGRLSAVALDVYTVEPPDISHPLFSHPRVVCTPHSIANTQGWNEKVFSGLATSLNQVLSGELPESVVNREALLLVARDQSRRKGR